MAANTPGQRLAGRWITAGADDGTEWITGLVGRDASALSDARKRERLLRGFTGLLLCRVVLPGYRFLNSYKANTLFGQCRQVFRPDLFAKTDAKAESLGIQRKQRSEAVKTITKMVVHTGKDLDELTADDVLGLRPWCLRELGGTPQGVVLAWVLVRGIADLGPSATLQEAVRLGQRPTIEIVDRYGFRDSNVRKVLLRYLDERRPGMLTICSRTSWPRSSGCSGPTSSDTTPSLTPCICPPTSPRHGSSGRGRSPGPAAPGEERDSLGYFQLLIRVRAFYLDTQEWAM